MSRSYLDHHENSLISFCGRDTAFQVELFDSRRSLNIGIFLRQFRASNACDELVAHLLAADSESIGAERLRALLKSLPDDDEMGKVLGYSGDPSRLAPAEKFCRDLATALPKLVELQLVVVYHHFYSPSYSTKTNERSKQFRATLLKRRHAAAGSFVRY